MTPKELFNQAYNLIKDPARWTQKAYARDANDIGVSSHSIYTVKWCSLGVLMKFGGDDSVTKALEYTINESLEDYNDTHTHAEVMAMWEETGEREGWL